jgi:uncharacterized protein (TIGR03083 family)
VPFVVESIASAEAEHYKEGQIMDVWNGVSEGRTAFADYLSTLPAADWAQPSWCAGWSVKDVTAHMLVPPTMSRGKVFVVRLQPQQDERQADQEVDRLDVDRRDRQGDA